MSIQHQIKHEPKPTDLPIKKIRVDGGTQPRIGIDDQTVDSYAEAISEGAVFPPVTVFHDGTDYWLADGFHRFRAHQKAGRAKIAVDVRQGIQRDAVLFSVGANATHGKPRCNEDKRRSVLTLLNDKEWSVWSDGEIAKCCAVSRKYVNHLRQSVTCNQVTSERSYVTKHGSVATMNVSAIGKAETQEASDLSDDDFFDPIAEEAERERAAELRAEQAAKQAHTQPQASTQAASDAPTDNSTHRRAERACRAV